MFMSHYATEVCNCPDNRHSPATGSNHRHPDAARHGPCPPPDRTTPILRPSLHRLGLRLSAPARQHPNLPAHRIHHQRNNPDPEAQALGHWSPSRVRSHSAQQPGLPCSIHRRRAKLELLAVLSSIFIHSFAFLSYIYKSK